jgi:3-oxoadipate enol-lactonase
MLVSGLPLLRGRHPQPRYARQAQFDASTVFDCTGRLGEITAPTLIVHGRSDRVAPVALAEEAHARIPGSRLLLLDGGHLFVFTGRQDRYMPGIITFLSEAAEAPAV